MSNWRPAKKWEQAGPIIESEGIGLCHIYGREGWEGNIDRGYELPVYAEEGTTPLIAAMRTFVAFKLGHEIEVPKILKLISKTEGLTK
jgi:hypothetical protein